MLLGTVDASLFVVNGHYHAKLVTLKNAHVYGGGAYGSNRQCSVDKDCRDYFFKTKEMLKPFRNNVKYKSCVHI